MANPFLWKMRENYFWSRSWVDRFWGDCYLLVLDSSRFMKPKRLTVATTRANREKWYNILPKSLHYTREIWKHNFIFTVKPTVHISPSQERSFSKTLFKPEEFDYKNTGFPFSSRLKTHQFWKRSLLNTNLKWLVTVAFLNSFSVMWTGNIWCVFKVKSCNLDWTRMHVVWVIH